MLALSIGLILLLLYHAVPFTERGKKRFDVAVLVFVVIWVLLLSGLFDYARKILT
jgi:multisubunit Na+/H+ antiporter MnhB subunit